MADTCPLTTTKYYIAKGWKAVLKARGQKGPIMYFDLVLLNRILL